VYCRRLRGLRRQLPEMLYGRNAHKETSSPPDSLSLRALIARARKLHLVHERNLSGRRLFYANNQGPVTAPQETLELTADVAGPSLGAASVWQKWREHPKRWVNGCIDSPFVVPIAWSWCAVLCSGSHGGGGRNRADATMRHFRRHPSRTKRGVCVARQSRKNPSFPDLSSNGGKSHGRISSCPHKQGRQQIHKTCRARIHRGRGRPKRLTHATVHSLIQSHGHHPRNLPA